MTDVPAQLLEGSHELPWSAPRCISGDSSAADGSSVERPVADTEEFQLTFHLHAASASPCCLDPNLRLSVIEFAELHAADDSVFQCLKDYLCNHGAVVVNESRAIGMLRVRGTAAHFGAALGLRWVHSKDVDGPHRRRMTAVRVPAIFKDAIAAVAGMDERPVLRHPSHHKKHHDGHMHHHSARAVGSDKEDHAPNDPFVAPAIALGKYRFPFFCTGAGQTIGIMAATSEYPQFEADCTSFTAANLPSHSPPPRSFISVDPIPPGPQPGVDAIGELALDSEWASIAAPDASQLIFTAPASPAGCVDTLAAAITQRINHGQPLVYTMSFGGSEKIAREQYPELVQAFSQKLIQAAQLGMTVLCASGDNGDGGNEVKWPASDPNILGCGGTKLVATAAGGVDPTVADVGWKTGDGTTQTTGGGVSEYNSVPDFQTAPGIVLPVYSGSAGLKGRTVPDVAACADGRAGPIWVQGRVVAMGGTSAVAPMLAGLFARINQLMADLSITTPRSSCGLPNSQLYHNFTTCFLDVVTGGNNLYPAIAGYDASTGLGTPMGIQIANLLAGKSDAWLRRGVTLVIQDKPSTSVFAASSGDGVEFAPYAQPIVGLNTDMNVGVSAASGKLVVLARVPSGPFSSIMQSTSTDGCIWTAPTTVFQGITSNYPPALTRAGRATGDVLIMAMAGMLPPAGALLYALSSDAGASWRGLVYCFPDTPRIVSQNAPALVALRPSGNVVMSFIQNGIVYASVGTFDSTGSRLTWGQPVTPFGDQTTTTLPTALAALPNGKVVLAVAASGQGNHNLYATVSSDGISWSGSAPVFAPIVGPFLVNKPFTMGGTLAGVAICTNDNSPSLYSITSPDGVSWSAPQQSVPTMELGVSGSLSSVIF